MPMAELEEVFEKLASLSFKEALVFSRPLLLFIIGIVIYTFFIYKFYRFVASRDIFELNLSQYNKTKNAGLKKTFSVLLYITEYIIIFPLFVFFWFAIFAAILIFLSKNADVENILLISIALVGAIRIASYYSEDLSRDLAKMMPFALLGVFLVDISYFSFDASLAALMQLPLHINIAAYYLLFIVVLEILLRILSFHATAFSPPKISLEMQQKEN